MALKWYTIVVDCQDVRAQSRWWAQALEWQIVHDSPEEVVLVPGWLEEDTWQQIPWEQRFPGLVFVQVPEGKAVKNRLHLDLVPHSSQDRDAEIQRLLDLGASLTDVGQNREEVTWTVLADPEGNEFCVLSAREF